MMAMMIMMVVHHDDRRAAQMRDTMIGEGVIDGVRPGRAQEHMCPGQHCDCPGKAPAVAVEQRQRP